MDLAVGPAVTAQRARKLLQRRKFYLPRQKQKIADLHTSKKAKSEPAVAISRKRDCDAVHVVAEQER
jgi:hypothetical protein